MQRSKATYGALDIVIGGRWLAEARRLQSDDAARWVGEYDPDVLRAPMDLVFNGRNLTSDLRDEPVLPLLGAWVDAALALASGARRARVELRESPVELALERHLDGVLLSVFDLGAPGRFRLERGRIALSDLLTTARGLVSGMHASAVAAGVRQVAPLEALLRRLDDVQVSADTAGQPQRENQTDPIVVESRTTGGLYMSTTLLPASTGLGVATDVAFDRHVLLAAGSLTIGKYAVALTLRGRPLRIVEDCVDSVAAILRGRRLERGTAPICTTLDGRLDLRITGGDAVVLVLTGGTNPVSLATGAEAILSLILEHAIALADAVVRLNSALGQSAHLTDLRTTSAELRARLHAHPGAPVAESSARSIPAAATPLPTGEAGGYDFPVGAIRRMRYERVWTLTRHGVRGRSLVPLDGERFVYAHGSGVEIVDAATGEAETKLTVEPADRLRIEDESTVVMGSDCLRILDHTTGEVDWTAPVGGCVRAAVSDSVVAVIRADGSNVGLARSDGGRVWKAAAVSATCFGLAASSETVVSSHPGELIGRSARSGAVAWRLRVPFERVACRFFGADLLVVADDPLSESSLVGIVDGARGEWIRRHAAAADVRAVGWSPGRGVSVLLSDQHEARVQVVDIESGVDWTATIPWNRSAEKARCRLDADGVVVTAGGLVARVRPSGLVWRLPDERSSGWRELRMARRDLGSGLVVLAGENEIVIVEAAGGRVLHRLPAFWEALSALSVDARGHLVAVEDVGGGEFRVHGVSAVGLIAALDGGLASA